MLPRFVSGDMVPVSPIINPCYGESLGRNAQTQFTHASIQPNFLQNTHTNTSLSSTPLPLTFYFIFLKKAQTNNNHDKVISYYYLGAVVERIEPAKPGVNPSLAQMGGEIGEDAAEKDVVIGRQLGLPDEIGGGSAAKSAIEGCELANLGRIHVGHDLGDAALGQFAQTGRWRCRFRRRRLGRRKAKTHQRYVEMKMRNNSRFYMAEGKGCEFVGKKRDLVLCLSLFPPDSGI